MTQLNFRFLALALSLSVGAAAFATDPGTITPEDSNQTQDVQNQNNNQVANGEDGWEENEDNYLDGDQAQDPKNNAPAQGNNIPDEDWNDDQGQGDYRDNQKGQGDYRRDDRRDDRRRRPGKRPRRGQPEVLNVPVRQQYWGGVRFPLYMLTNNLAQFQGLRLVGVTVVGSSEGGMGGAFFCASTCSQMSNVGFYVGAYYVQTTGEPLNQFSSQWFLELRGTSYVDSIQLQFAR